MSLGSSSAEGGRPARLQTERHQRGSVQLNGTILEDVHSSSLPARIDLDVARPLRLVSRVEGCDALKLLEALDLVGMVDHHPELGSKGRDAVLEGGEVREEGEREGKRVQELQSRGKGGQGGEMVSSQPETSARSCDAASRGTEGVEASLHR